MPANRKIKITLISLVISSQFSSTSWFVYFQRRDGEHLVLILLGDFKITALKGRSAAKKKVDGVLRRL